MAMVQEFRLMLNWHGSAENNVSKLHIPHKIKPKISCFCQAVVLRDLQVLCLRLWMLWTGSKKLPKAATRKLVLKRALADGRALIVHPSQFTRIDQ